MLIIIIYSGQLGLSLFTLPPPSIRNQTHFKVMYTSFPFRLFWQKKQNYVSKRTLNIVYGNPPLKRENGHFFSKFTLPTQCGF